MYGLCFSFFQDHFTVGTLDNFNFVVMGVDKYFGNHGLYAINFSRFFVTNAYVNRHAI